MLNGPDKENFGTADKYFLAALRPHLEHALELYARLNRNELEKIIYEDAINQLGIGTIVLNGHGAVIETNQVAQEILHEHSCISVINGNLILSGAEHANMLEHLIKQALAWRDTRHAKPFVDALRIECPGESSVGLLIRNAPADPWYQNEANPSAVVYISDLTKQLSAPEQLVARIFGLTRSEASLATLLANGASLAEAALAMKLAESSVRTYLKRVFSKVGVSRQAELVRVIVKSVALLAGPDPTERSDSTRMRGR
jgi:DNA-binding CsgD family transcriptional regulator